MVALVLNGIGRFNAGQAAVMTVQGISASVSPAIGGALAQWLGYPATFAILGSFAPGSLAPWLTAASTLRAATIPNPVVPRTGFEPVYPA